MPQGDIDLLLQPAQGKYHGLRCIDDPVSGFGTRNDLEAGLDASCARQMHQQSDQQVQADDRSIIGGNLTYQQALAFNNLTQLSLGLQYRLDDADVGLFKTQARNPFLTVRNDNIREASLGGYAALDQQGLPWLRSVAAPRIDHFDFDVNSNTAALPNTQLSVSLFVLRLDSELVYVGDAGATEALGGSRRRGVELGIVHSPTPWLVIDGDLTYTRARFAGADTDDRIPLAVERTASLGLIVDNLNRFSGGLRFRYLGEAPLVEDNSVRTDATLLVNLEAGYRISPRWSVSFEVLNLLNSDDFDITYFYASQLAGESVPVEDIHFHPVEPRAIRIGISGRF